MSTYSSQYSVALSWIGNATLLPNPTAHTWSTWWAIGHNRKVKMTNIQPKNRNRMDMYEVMNFSATLYSAWF